MEEGHKSHYAQAPKEPRRAKRHVCQKCLDDVFRVHNRNKHHPCKTPLEDQSTFPEYIDVAMIEILNDQITQTKVCLSHLYEK